MDYGHVASDKVASICERNVLSLDIRVLILYRKRTFHSAIWSVNGSHFVNYCMIFFFSHVDVVYKSNYNLKTKQFDNCITRIKHMATLVTQVHCDVF